jgi:hypothetical protein
MSQTRERRPDLAAEPEVPAGRPGAPISTRARLMAFVVIVLVCAAGAAAYVGYADRRTKALSGSAPPAAAAATADLAAMTRQPFVLFRGTAYGPDYGKLQALALDHVDGTRLVSDLKCERVDMAAGRGVCLHVAARGSRHTIMVIFDERLQKTATVPIVGLPSRVRLSPDGRLAATTVFVTGDSYANGSFSTRTAIFDLNTAKLVLELEDLEVTLDGERIHEVDFNFWGVTFAKDPNTFYATLGTGGHTYLVQGDLAARTARVLRDGVECPSLSPDGTRIAFKQRTDATGPVQWRLAVLDLDTLVDHPLAETHTVDDQAGWLDDATVTYGRPEGDSDAVTNTWAVPADGSGAPHVMLPRSWSAVFPH